MFEKFLGIVFLICTGLFIWAVIESNGFSFESTRIIFIVIGLFTFLYVIFTQSTPQFQTHQDITIYPEEIIKHKAFKLANNNCKIQYLYDEKKIICFNNYSNEKGEKEYVISSLGNKQQEFINDVWFVIFQFFSETTTFENISNTLYKSSLQTETFYMKEEEATRNIQKANLLDINSATEKEITALPGINIIMAKKAIKYICENNGFKSVDEFFSVLQIKEPFKAKIQDVICTLPVDIKNKKDEPPQNNERTIDL